MVNVIISEIMDKHHSKLDKLFREVKNKINTEEAEETFNHFKWELEKHFFIEEKAIFTQYSPKDREEYVAMPYVLEEHNLLLDLMKELEYSLKEGNEVDFKKFEELLDKHKKFEDQSFYPRLDKNLQSSDKQEIVRKIKEITF